MTDNVVTLGEAERDRVWESSLTGAQFRYADGGWQILTHLADWTNVSVARPGTQDQVVFARAGEWFEEVDSS